MSMPVTLMFSARQSKEMRGELLVRALKAARYLLRDGTLRDPADLVPQVAADNGKARVSSSSRT